MFNPGCSQGRLKLGRLICSDALCLAPVFPYPCPTQACLSFDVVKWILWSATTVCGILCWWFKYCASPEVMVVEYLRVAKVY